MGSLISEWVRLLVAMVAWKDDCMGMGMGPRFACKLVLGSLEMCLGFSNPHAHTRHQSDQM